MSRFKVVLLGEGRVGKTSVLLRYIKGEFSDRQQSTVDASYHEKHITLGQTRHTLDLWDTAGQERFHALGPIYYRDANAALLVFDITDKESFNKVRQWVAELHEFCGSSILLFIAGNKIDLESRRAVSVEEAEAFALQVGAHLCFVSAKSGKGVDAAFLEVLKGLIKTSQERTAAASGPGRNRGSTVNRRRRDRITVSDGTPAPSGGCC